ncbi:MAG: hypothetical protein WCS94_10120 [Verrucomicrobiota bacterium]
MGQKLLNQPVRLLFITYLTLPVMTLAIHGSSPRLPAPHLAVRPSADMARPRPRHQHVYQYWNEGVERWGLNE